ncbi:ATP-binding protein [Lactobacillus crispatus]|uniref:ATP-binding protein n=1 Tax=Lactobacillus crispatus TaxID=47770 RepID=UPI0022E352E1|nr:ATP-binding protein [Lactobacillus crispatus]
MRHGDRSEKATPIEQNNLLLKGMNKTFDALPTSYKLPDVSFTLLAATFKKETGEDFDISRDLISMGFVTQDNIVTNAGLLLCDQGYLRQSKIVCTRWKGIEKGSVDGDALDDEEFTDASLITLLSNAEAFIRTNSKNPWTIRGMRREENSDYPFKAVREVLVNALIHRDYQIQGSEVHVDMFDDRMEIVSPGGMINGSRIQDLNLKHVPSMRRNEIISDIFGRLHYMDRRGSGIQRILSAYTNFVEQPSFYSDDTVFLVTLPNRGIATPKSPLQSEKSPLQSEKSPLQSGKSPLQGEENNIIKKWKEKGIDKIFREQTIEKLLEFYMRYSSEYSFNRNLLANFLEIAPNSASKIIQKCREIGIMRMEKRGVYFFTDLG